MSEGATRGEKERDDLADLRGSVPRGGDGPRHGLRLPREEPRPTRRRGAARGLHAVVPFGRSRGRRPQCPRGASPRDEGLRARRREPEQPTPRADARHQGNLRCTHRALGLPRCREGSPGGSGRGRCRDSEAPTRAKPPRVAPVPPVADVRAPARRSGLLAHRGRDPDGPLGADRHRLFLGARPGRRGSRVEEVASRSRRLPPAPRRVEPAREEGLQPRRHGEGNR